MPQHEMTGKRCLAYSAWHRSASIKRYLNGNKVLADRLTMIDIDAIYVEAKHPYDRPPVAIAEVARVYFPLEPQTFHKKSGAIIQQLGKAANIPTFLVLYKCHEWKMNPASIYEPDIEEFYVKELWPAHDKKWSIYSPEKYARFLVYLRQNHLKIKANGPQLQLPIGDIAQLDDDDLERRWYVDELGLRDYAR